MTAMPAPTDDAKRAAKIAQCRRAGQARAAQFTKAHQEAAGRARGLQMTVAELSAMGKKGYQRAVAKHGHEKVFAGMRHYQLAHPSQHEQDAEPIIAELCEQRGVRYERIWRIFVTRMHSCDFYIHELKLAIEIDGEPHTEDFNREKAAKARVEKKALLREYHPDVRLVELDWREKDTWRAQLAEAMGDGKLVTHQIRLQIDEETPF